MKPAKVSKFSVIAEVEDDRTGEVCRVYNDDLSKTLPARIESFTGYSTKFAESYQIVNYGLGGHYVPHHDAFGEYVRNMRLL